MCLDAFISPARIRGLAAMPKEEAALAIRAAIADTVNAAVGLGVADYRNPDFVLKPIPFSSVCRLFTVVPEEGIKEAVRLTLDELNLKMAA